MATAKAQRKWRDKHRFVKTQLNVMARKLTHRYLDEVAGTYGLKGKGEAVAFCCFVTKAMMQRSDFDDEMSEILDVFATTYREDRDIYAA